MENFPAFAAWKSRLKSYRGRTGDPYNICLERGEASTFWAVRESWQTTSKSHDPRKPPFFLFHFVALQARVFATYLHVIKGNHRLSSCSI